MESAEYAEKNKANVINQIRDLSNEWVSLGVKMPVAVVGESVITWKHDRFRELSDGDPIPQHFPDVLKGLRRSDGASFLGYVACYLFCIGCERIYITDQSHDGGIDLVGAFGPGNLAHVGIFVQAKSSEGTSTKRETLLAEYAKFLLLRKMGKWSEYLRCLGLNESLSGLSPVYLFATNAEFSNGIRAAARDLEAGLRTGKQIAATISDAMSVAQLEAALDVIKPFKASLEMNLAKRIRSAIASN